MKCFSAEAARPAKNDSSRSGVARAVRSLLELASRVSGDLRHHIFEVLILQRIHLINAQVRSYSGGTESGRATF